MKSTIYLLIPIFIFSCEFNIPKKKDFLPETDYIEAGLAADNVWMIVNGEKENRNEIVFGERVEVIFNAVSGFQREEGIAYPGLKMVIVSASESDTLFFSENVLADQMQGLEDDPLKLEAFFVNILPVGNYKAYIKAFDIRSSAYLTYDMPFEVIKNDRISVVEFGLKRKNVYLWDETKGEIIADNIVTVDNKTSLVLEGLEGFKDFDSIVFPKFSVKLTDNKDNIIINEENILSQYEETGASIVAVTQQVSTFLNFERGELNNPYKLEATILDSKSGKKIDVVTFLNLAN
ncbi:MAG: hypothetical protein ABF242_09580 [Flavobacteriales bacterium]